jgi:hypothetical protein
VPGCWRPFIDPSALDPQPAIAPVQGPGLTHSQALCFRHDPAFTSYNQLEENGNDLTISLSFSKTCEYEVHRSRHQTLPGLLEMRGNVPREGPRESHPVQASSRSRRSCAGLQGMQEMRPHLSQSSHPLHVHIFRLAWLIHPAISLDSAVLCSTLAVEKLQDDRRQGAGRLRLSNRL